MYNLSTIIEFVKDPNWFPSFENAQTGDLLGFILFVSIILLVFGFVGLCAYLKSRNAVFVGSNMSFIQKYSKPLRAIWISIITLLVISCVIFAFTNNSKAQASDSQISVNEKVYAYVNPDIGSVNIENAMFTNNCLSNAKVTSVNLDYLEGQMDFQNVNWKLYVGMSKIYDGVAPGTAECQALIDDQKNVSFGVSGFSAEQLYTLIDKQVLKVNYTVEQCETPELYNIDMMPQQNTYLDDIVDISSGFNLSFSTEIDQSTRNHANKLLSINGNSKLNLMLGVNTSENYAKQFVLDNNFYDESVYAKNDGYQILMLHNGCAILGKDTNAVFMGVTTLGYILDSYLTSSIRSFITNDWAVAKYRGFIEGYYGIPWSPENRLDLQEFGGKFKMNTYIFAPKDDEYHSARWYEPYPEDKLVEMKKYVDKGIETKVSFAWAIHPFRGEGQFDWHDYDNQKKLITDKFDQLYNIGVRKFGLSADDMDKTAIIEDQVRLLKDLEKWAKDKGDITSLIFVPKIYNKSFIYSEFEEEYLRGMRELDDFFDIMWTGDAVMGPCETSTFDLFKDYTNHEAFMWMNFPVNDYCDKCLLMGKGQIMKDNVTNYKGLVSNPMQQAQASKVALYETAYYTWRNYANDEERTKAWKDSFKYIDSGASEALGELCKHLSNWTANTLDLEESEDLAPLLNYCTDKINNDQQIEIEKINQLISEYEKIKSALADFSSNHTNNALYTEMEPWILAFDEQCDSSIDALNALNKWYTGDVAAAKTLYIASDNKLALSQRHKIPSLEGEDNYAQPGSKRLFPYAVVMHDYLRDKLHANNSNF